MFCSITFQLATGLQSRYPLQLSFPPFWEQLKFGQQARGLRIPNCGLKTRSWWACYPKHNTLGLRAQESDPGGVQDVKGAFHAGNW